MKLTFTKGSQKIIIDDKGKGINNILTTDKSKTDYPQIKLTKGNVTKYFQTKWSSHKLTVGREISSGFIASEELGWSSGRTKYFPKKGALSPETVDGIRIDDLYISDFGRQGTTFFMYIQGSKQAVSRTYYVTLGNLPKVVVKPNSDTNATAEVSKAHFDYLKNNNGKTIDITISTKG